MWRSKKKAHSAENTTAMECNAMQRAQLVQACTYVPVCMYRYMCICVYAWTRVCLRQDSLFETTSRKLRMPRCVQMLTM